jgi:hypothetical protein
MPRAALRGEEKAGMALITTDVSVLLGRGHMVLPKKNIKRDTCVCIENAVSVFPDVTVYDVRTRSTPSKENAEFDDEGKLQGKTSNELSYRETSHRNEMISSLVIDFREMRFAPQDDKTGARTIAGEYNGLDLTATENLEQAATLVRASLKNRDLSSDPGAVAAGIYEFEGAVSPMSQSGLYFSDEVLIANTERILEKIKCLSIVRSNGYLRHKAMNRILVDLNNGETIAVDSVARALEVLREYGIKLFMIPSTVEPVAAAYSEDVADQKKADKKAKAEEIKEWKKNKNAKK